MGVAIFYSYDMVTMLNFKYNCIGNSIHSAVLQVLTVLTLVFLTHVVALVGGAGEGLVIR